MKDNILKIKELFSRILNDIYFESKSWKEEVWDRDLDELDCCDGRDCCCSGRTLRQNYKRNYYD